MSELPDRSDSLPNGERESVRLHQEGSSAERGLEDHDGGAFDHFRFLFSSLSFVRLMCAEWLRIGHDGFYGETKLALEALFGPCVFFLSRFLFGLFSHLACCSLCVLLLLCLFAFSSFEPAHFFSPFFMSRSRLLFFVFLLRADAIDVWLCRQVVQ